MSLELVTDLLLPFALFTMMFGIGASTSLSEFAGIHRAPGPLILGILSLCLISPVIGCLFAHLMGLPAELALGLVLLAACPGGLFSNYMTALARGSLALSISLTSIASLIYIFMAPFWARQGMLLLDDGVSAEIIIPYSKVLQPLLVFLLLPVLSGLILTSYRPGLSARLNKLLRDAGGVTAIICFLIIVYAQRETFSDNFSLSFWPVLIFNLVMVSVAALLACLLALKSEAITAMLIEHTIRQEATGIYIALVILESLDATMPLLVNTLIGMSISTVIILLARIRQGAR